MDVQHVHAALPFGTATNFWPGVTDVNRADGFSPGSSILVKRPDLQTIEQFRAMDLPPIEMPAIDRNHDVRNFTFSEFSTSFAVSNIKKIESQTLAGVAEAT